MNRFSQFTIEELRELQNVLSNTIENDDTAGVFDYDGEAEITSNPIHHRLLAEVMQQIENVLTLLEV
jgi:hypothetical protein